MKRIILFFFAFILIAACAKTPQPEQPVIEEPDPVFQDNSPAEDGYGVLTKAEEAKLSRVNQFAFTLMQKMEETIPGSTYVFSPLSMAYVLGMLSDGADGTTKEEICSALGFGASGQKEISSFLKSLTAKVERSLSPAQEEAYANEGVSPRFDAEAPVMIANVIIADNDFPIKESYRASARDFYSAMVENYDFGTEDVAKYINDWASEHTAGRISRVTDRVTDNENVCFINALNFKAKWKRYKRYVVKSLLFLGEKGQRNEIMLQDAQQGLYYYKGENYALAEIPLLDQRNLIAANYRFVIILPDIGYRISDIDLTEESWKQATTSTEQVMAFITFPKFETSFDSYKDSVIDLLRLAGITTAFSDDADFSPFTDADMKVSDVKHLSNITVNENGVAGSAITYVSGGSGVGLPNIIFRADRPFIFAVTEKTTGAILFLGCYR